MLIKLFYGPSEVGLYDTVIKRYTIYNNIEQNVETRARDIMKYIQPLYEYGMPEGEHLQLFENKYIEELKRGAFPWLSASSIISTSEPYLKEYLPVPSDLKSGLILETDIPDDLFLSQNAASRNVAPAFSGHKDKFPGQIICNNGRYLLTTTARSKVMGNVIIKPQDQRYPYICENEFICMQLAERVGINVPRSWLCKDKSGKLQYCVERFGIYRDKKGNVLRENIVDFLGVLNVRAKDKYYVSLDDLFGCAQRFLTDCDMNAFARMWYFGYIIGNTDMHPKNFSMFIRPGNKWKLAPGYDMVHMPCYGQANHNCLKQSGKNHYSSVAEIEEFLNPYLSVGEREEIKNAVYLYATPLISYVFAFSLKYGGTKNGILSSERSIGNDIRVKMMEYFCPK